MKRIRGRFAALGAALLLALFSVRLWPAPDDGGPPRPHALPATRYSQHDVQVGGVRLQASQFAATAE